MYSAVRVQVTPRNKFVQLFFAIGSVTASNVVGGCELPAAVSVAVGSGTKPEKGMKVLDLNLRSKWVSFGKENSLWLELAAPTIIDSVAVAFRKVGVVFHGYW